MGKPWHNFPRTVIQQYICLTNLAARLITRTWTNGSCSHTIVWWEQQLASVKIWIIRPDQSMRVVAWGDIDKGATVNQHPSRECIEEMRKILIEDLTGPSIILRAHVQSYMSEDVVSRFQYRYKSCPLCRIELPYR
jgi:hypothetical protein